MAVAPDPVSLFLLSIAGILLIGAIGEVVFQRTSIPDVVWLILAGIVLGPVLGFVTPALLGQIAPYFAAITLVIVLFEGGTALELGELSQAAPRSSVLALASFGCSVIAVTLLSQLGAVVGLLPEQWSWMHGLLLGTILGGSSSIIIMPVMAQAKLPAKVSNLVNLESALTDALCVVGTSALIGIMTGAASDSSPGMTLAKSFGIALAIGLSAGLFWMLLLRFLHASEHAYPLTLAALLVLYVVIDNAGGSAALGILTVAIMLGNAPRLARLIGLQFTLGLQTQVRGFHRQMAFMIKSFFFVFIGAMLNGPWSQLLLGGVIAALLLGARIPAVWLATVGGGFSKDERSMVSVALPRGMAAGVLATLPLSRGVAGTEQLPVIVFACVLTTIAVFAVGFPLIKRRLSAVTAAPPPTAVAPAGSVVAAGGEAFANEATLLADWDATQAGATPTPGSSKEDTRR